MGPNGATKQGYKGRGSIFVGNWGGSKMCKKMDPFISTREKF